MPELFKHHLDLIRNQPALLSSLADLNRGIEKESLRITPEGRLSQKPHPAALGSALSHPKITTDYSESLLEFITPVHKNIKDALADLEDIHHFTYLTLAKQDELLWTNSMPCQLGEEKDIPIAQYGRSNVAKMKTIYREGLGLRYGRHMQTISGIHYNFSVSDKFWAKYQLALEDKGAASTFKTTHYFGLIRNFKRYVPLLVYLFGASPALCRSFLKGGQAHDLDMFDEHSWFNEYATSLRMGDLGYQSSEQSSLYVCYNSIDDYISSLRAAITEPHTRYEKMGLTKENGELQQLNTALLQIENEFYSTIRPKRIAASGEAPVNALARGGVEYIEVRCIDINPFTATGIDTDIAKFLDLFLLYCLLNDSPQFSALECQQADINLKSVVTQGRKPGLKIQTLGQASGHMQDFQQWGLDLLDNMLDLAKVLDSLKADNAYQQSLKLQHEKLLNSNLTPSARVLELMRTQHLTFAEFSRQQSQQWQSHFIHKPISQEKIKRFQAHAANSMAHQQTIEAADKQSFEDYLNTFYSQY